MIAVWRLVSHVGEPWIQVLVATLGARAVELVEAMRPLAERIMAAGEVPKRNNMGLPWPGQ